MSDCIPVTTTNTGRDDMEAVWRALCAALPPANWRCSACDGLIESGMGLMPAIFAGGARGCIISATIYVRCEPCHLANTPIPWEPPIEARTKELKDV